MVKGTASQHEQLEGIIYNYCTQNEHQVQTLDSATCSKLREKVSE
jgi:hypothetical protein